MNILYFIIPKIYICIKQMSRGIAFFTAVVILGLVLVLFPKMSSSEGFLSSSSTTPNQEKEQEFIENTNKQIQEKAMNPALAQMGIGTVEPSLMPPVDLPFQPIEVRAKGAPLPYVDPATEYAKYIRIKGVLEDLQAFQGFEAQSLQDMCDPSIQLPLTNLKADVETLKSAVSVMDRNPGVKSTVTTKQLNDMSYNVQFLRDKKNKLVANNVIAEGFVASQEQEKERATYKELQEFDTKLMLEKLRIASSGTTDPNVIARISTLDRIHEEINDILKQVDEGVTAEEDIPVYKSDINSALPNLGDLSKPLPQAITKAGLPSWLLNLFPGGLSASDTTQLLAFKKSLESYTQAVSAVAADAFAKYKLGPSSSSPATAELFTDSSLLSRDQALLSIHGGNLPGPRCQQRGNSSILPSLFNPRLDAGLPGTEYPEEYEQKGGFDWKSRAELIGERVALRGLDPRDFGIMEKGTEVSDEFSWRGYARMICSRLMATTDPGLPETCGCPPYTWNGWSE
jgi:hypothetical protein